MIHRDKGCLYDVDEADRRDGAPIMRGVVEVGGRRYQAGLFPPKVSLRSGRWHYPLRLRPLPPEEPGPGGVAPDAARELKQPEQQPRQPQGDIHDNEN